MSHESNSMASRLRELAFRRLPPDRYLEELAVITDLNDGETWASKHDDAGVERVSAVDKVLALRARILMLEQKVRELEARQ